MEKFDRVYIGTGPISVADSCHFSKENRKTLFIDDKAQVGGAWVAISIGDYGELEIGCHIWSYNKKVYRFLEEFFDLDLIDLTPQPYFLRGSLKLVYDQKHAITTLKSFGQKLSKGQVKSALKFLSNDPSARIPVIPKKYRYPRGGARDLQKSIATKIAANGFTTMLGRKVTSLKRNADLWELDLSNGEKIAAETVVLTATSAIEEIVMGDQKMSIEHKSTNYTHYHLVVKGNPKKPCSYVRVLGHPFIHRISEITYQLETAREQEETLYIVGVFDDQLPAGLSENEIAEKLISYLTQHGFIGSDNALIYAQKNKFETTYIPRDQRPILNALPNIELLATTDLIYGFHGRMEKWSIV